MKFTPIAWRRTRACPGPGSGTGTSSTTRDSGPPGSWTRMAFMARPYQNALVAQGGGIEGGHEREVAPVAFVEDALQEQARRRRGQPRRHVRVLTEEARDVADRERAPSDLDQHADDAAHHLPHEVRALDAHEDEVARVRDLEPFDADLGGLLLRVVVGERAEV